MVFEKLKENTYFAYGPELEPLFAAFCILYDETRHTEWTKIYSEAQVEDWKKRYLFLFETYDCLKKLNLMDLLDVIQDVFDDKFTLDRLYDWLLSLPAEERLFRLADFASSCGITKDEIKKGLSDDEVLNALYLKAGKECSGFLGFSTFIKENDRFLKDLFSLAKEMDTPALREAFKACDDRISELRACIIEKLETMDALECSESFMGKTFRNRGPYEKFCFVPSLLLPFNYIRLFYEDGTIHNKQLLLCSIREKEKGREDTVAVLKAFADETRYMILKLLLVHGPMKGLDIVKELKLAPSTISHHMTELKDCGLVTEEPVKTAKYYGISVKRLKDVLDRISKDFDIDIPFTCSYNQKQ